VRKFKCAWGEIVDLDDPKTYEYLPDTLTNLRNAIWLEVGYSHVWQEYWHPDGRTEQPERVKGLVKELADNYRENYSNLLWLQEFLFRFQDEIENMC